MPSTRLNPSLSLSGMGSRSSPVGMAPVIRCRLTMSTTRLTCSTDATYTSFCHLQKRLKRGESSPRWLAVASDVAILVPSTSISTTRSSSPPCSRDLRNGSSACILCSRAVLCATTSCRAACRSLTFPTVFSVLFGCTLRAGEGFVPPPPASGVAISPGSDTEGSSSILPAAAAAAAGDGAGCCAFSSGVVMAVLRGFLAEGSYSSSRTYAEKLGSVCRSSGSEMWSMSPSWSSSIWPTIQWNAGGYISTNSRFWASRSRAWSHRPQNSSLRTVPQRRQSVCRFTLTYSPPTFSSNTCMSTASDATNSGLPFNSVIRCVIDALKASRSTLMLSRQSKATSRDCSKLFLPLSDSAAPSGVLRFF
mmetsp:Transcript_10381/g.29984  ORF Transcript_10381/g.29984 Transcript_10381/m.29984 type:complete len:363 (-) Transcript_10381:156-1244(-)